MNSQDNNFPSFLASDGKLISHFRTQFENLSSKERGDVFADFVEKLIPLSEIGRKFEKPIRRQATHDKGIDFECKSKEGNEVLFVQAKYTLPDVDEFDSIFSKFKAYETEISSTPTQLSFLGSDQEQINSSPLVIHYMVVTTQDLAEILNRYRKSKRPSKPFFEQLLVDGRIHLIDIQQILLLVKSAYRKTHFLPSNLTLNLVTNFITTNGVYIGVIEGTQLKSLFEEFGDALFFENVREFLGPSSGKVNTSEKRITVNQAIVATLENEPDKFLARNNGITFRTDEIREINPTTLELDNASIVNGCQTTMGIVQNPRAESCILVKIVKVNDSWDIAKAANFQNSIDQIDLDLARYIRPQIIRLMASHNEAGYSDAMDNSAFAVLDAIYQDRVSYEEIRSLYIGLFSFSPNNAIAVNYTELNTNLIAELYTSDENVEKVFDTIFRIYKVARLASHQAQEIFSDKAYASVFQRFWKDNNPKYRAFLFILTACGAIRENIYDQNIKVNSTGMIQFLERVGNLVDTEPDIYIRYYRHAFTAIGANIMDAEKDPSQMIQDLYSIMKGSSKFNTLYQRVCMFADNDDNLRNLSG